MTTEVELLREAAATMRVRAAAATPGPWYEDNIDGIYAYGRPEDGGCPPVFKTLFGTYADVQHAAAFASPAVALAVADWLDREARRVGPHAITTYEVREDWWAYSCHTCGVGGSTSNAGLAGWQDAHANVRLGADEAALAVARAYLGRAES